MKKLLFVALILLGIGVLASSCTKNDKNMLLGTWKLTSVVANESTYDVDYLSGMTMSFSETTVVVSYGDETFSLPYEKVENYLILHQEGRTLTWTILSLTSTQLEVKADNLVLRLKKV